MGLLGKFQRKRDDDDDIDEFEDESFDDDEGSSSGLLGRMRRKIKRSGGDDEDEDDDVDDGLDENEGGSNGIFGRMRRNLRRNDDDDEDDDDGVPAPGPAAPTAGGDIQPAPDAVGSPSSDAVANNQSQLADPPVAAPTAVYIVDGPEGGETAPETADSSEGADAQDEGAGEAVDSESGSMLDLIDIFESEEEVDVAFKDLVDSVGDVSASELAIQLQDLMAVLDQGN